MSDFGRTCLAPALSRRSGKIVTRNIWDRATKDIVFFTDPSLREPSDGGTRPSNVFESGGNLIESDGNVFEWSGGEGRPDFVLPDIRYRCPTCGNISMRFSLGNVMWD